MRVCYAFYMTSRKAIEAIRIDSKTKMPEDTESLVDITLIEEMLRLSPEERLLQNDRMIRTIMELRDAFQST
jgi:hypothetical protein